MDSLFGQELTEALEIEGTGPEKVRTLIYPVKEKAAETAARKTVEKILKRSAENRRLVLGLATGTTAIPFYEALAEIHQTEGISFKNVITFGLDEYYPIAPGSPRSYESFLRKVFLSRVDIPEENIHFLKGDVPEDELYEYCASYEAAILLAGGIDIQILGVGRTGHVGFNEPGSPENTITRAVSVDRLTRLDVAEEFSGLENVPSKALTMGIGTIMKARKIFLMAWGKHKAAILKSSLEGDVTPRIPPTIFQHHSDTTFFLDGDAASELTRFHTPWLVGSCRWNDRLIRKAVVWLCLRVEKPILKLTDRHYSDHGLGELLTKHGPSNRINIKVFNDLQHTITGWPGGKPGVDDANRPERNSPHPKTCLIFSPHPDDDVISMGGTLSRLVEQGHQVHVAYQTSGNVAVADEYILKYLHFMDNFDGLFSLKAPGARELKEELRAFLASKTVEQIDDPRIRLLKGLVRRGEALAACGSFDIPGERLHFLDLPFYETGSAEKQPPGDKDVRIVMDLLEKLQPHQIYAAGDLADPHGTHKVCFEIIREALDRLKKKGRPWLGQCRLWLYRGAWQEWELEKVDMAVPISPDELAKKTRAILKHTSQKDGALFMGEDQREFWQRAEERNRSTARLYDRLGMAEYEAFELFVRLPF